MGRAVKMTTTASGRIAGSKRQIGEALCCIAVRKKAMNREKNTTSQEKLLRLVNKIKAIVAVCIALTVFFGNHHFMQTVVLKLERKR